ncbi:MAG: DUF1698 domain-containing protein [Acidobacteria bacterium]|nr:DUF1698 domain-containing protein [Acidobacteriota bacterium]
MPPIRPNDPACEAWNRMLMDEYAEKGFYHSIPLPDGRVLEGILPLDALRERLNEFPIAPDLSGKRVLDIGAWDGFFAFEMERRGADVVAIDNVEVENFHVARQLLNSKAQHHVQDVYDLSSARNGRFDIVLFMGVLYHLKHPLLALERVCEVTRELAIVESFVTNEAPAGEAPVLQFYETNELLGQIDNWCGPNIQCLLAMCRTAGFARAELIRVLRQRALVACYRHWLAGPAEPAFDPPLLLDCTDSSNYGVNVRRKSDQYLAAFFKSREKSFTLDTLFPEVGGCGIRPVSVHYTGGDGWQANFLLPPGLDAGWHDVRLRTAHSRYSNTVRIAVDVAAHADSLKITGACDATSWRPGEIAAGEDACVSLWVAGLPVNADRANVRVTLGGQRWKVQDVAPDKGDQQPRQINARAPKSFPKGRHELVVALGDVQSEPLAMRVV